MKWRMLRTGDAADWNRVLSLFPRSDIYFLPAYHRVYELNGDGTAYAFVAEDGDRRLFYPFFLRTIEKVGVERIEGTWMDVETVRGHNGPLCTTDDRLFLDKAWGEYFAWCDEHHVVAEFTRFNLYMDNQRHIHPSWTVIRHGEAVVLNLEGTEDDLSARYLSVQRNMVRKALSKGLVCEEVPPADGLNEFRRLYTETMDRVKALPAAYYSDAYFQALCTDLGGMVKLWTVRDRDRIVAAAMFLLYGDHIYYHLAGSDASQRGSAPNNLLLHTVALWGWKNGYRSFFLGGGGGNKGIFDFKASLSRERLGQYIGRRIHNKEAYDMLCAQWMRQKGVSELPNYTFPYRMD